MICDFFITFRRSTICISFRLKIYVFPFLPFCYCLQWQFRFSIFPVHLKSTQFLMFLELIFILLLTYWWYPQSPEIWPCPAAWLYLQNQPRSLQTGTTAAPWGYGIQWRTAALLCQCLKGSLPKRPLLCPHGGRRIYGYPSCHAWSQTECSFSASL